MTPDFVTVPERNIYRLRNATVASPLLSELPPGAPVSPDGLALVDVFVRDGLIAAVVPPETREGPEASVDLARAQLWPCLIDVHTHLDKGHTWERAENQDGDPRRVGRPRRALVGRGRPPPHGVRDSLQLGARYEGGADAPGLLRDAGRDHLARVRDIAQGVGRPSRPSSRLAGSAADVRHAGGRRAGGSGRGRGRRPRRGGLHVAGDRPLARSSVRARRRARARRRLSLRRERRRRRAGARSHCARGAASALPGPRGLRSLL